MSGTVRNMKLLILLLYPALILSQDSDYLLQELKSLRAGIVNSNCHLLCDLKSYMERKRRSGFRRNFTVVFLLFLDPGGFPNLVGNHIDLTLNNLSKATMKIRRNQLLPFFHYEIFFL